MVYRRFREPQKNNSLATFDDLNGFLEYVTKNNTEVATEQKLALIEGVRLELEERESTEASNSTLRAFALSGGVLSRKEYLICVCSVTAICRVSREKDGVGNIVAIVTIGLSNRIVVPLNPTESRFNEYLTRAFVDPIVSSRNNLLVCFMESRVKDRKRLIKRWSTTNVSPSSVSLSSSQLSISSSNFGTLFYNNGFPSDKFVDKFFVISQNAPISVKIGQNLFDVSPYHHENIIRVASSSLPTSGDDDRAAAAPEYVL